MVVVKVTVHPQGLGPIEAAKVWYFGCSISKRLVTHLNEGKRGEGEGVERGRGEGDSIY